MSYEGLSNLHLMAAARNYNAWMFRTVRPFAGNRILEIGAGIGTFTAFLADRERVAATEMDPECLSELSRRFRSRPNVEVVPLDISGVEGAIAQRLRGSGFDTILCLNVLEHIRDDVQALKNMKSLAPEGKLILAVPAFPSLYGVEDKAVGHYRRYSRRELAEKTRAAGYRVDRIFYFNSLGAIFWFLKGRVLSSPPTTPANVSLYDRLFVPVLSLIESAVPVPFGQSLIIVATAMQAGRSNE
jgi:SAM-dependent methyltransferase